VPLRRPIKKWNHVLNYRLVSLDGNCRKARHQRQARAQHEEHDAGDESHVITRQRCRESAADPSLTVA
jgi:hypothetical protein